MKPIDLLKKYEDNCELKNFTDVIEQASILNREILLTDVCDEAAENIEMLIRFWNDVDTDIPVLERKPIKLFINSPGGYVSAGLVIVDAIKLSKTPVYTIVVGTAYSMGLNIAIAGHKRYCYKNATYLFHEGSIGSSYVDANKFKNLADFYKVLLVRTKELLLSQTAITEEWYKEHQNDDVWLFPEDAIKLGLVDSILTEII